MKKKILFICQPQYGYQIDYFNYCKYLINDFSITYLCLDSGRDKFLNDTIKVIYVQPHKNRFVTNYIFLKCVIQLIRKEQFDIGFIYRFMGCFILPVLLRNRIQFNLDIRSGSVVGSNGKILISNLIVTFESFFFSNVSVISEGLRKLLYISKNKAYILKLGCDPINIKEKKFETETYNLLYVGTLNNRNIHDTILGVDEFLKNNFKRILLKYTIVGMGNKATTENLKSMITNKGLENVVTMAGYIKTTELLPYYEDANIGISYVPITKYFDSQPPTKTYEYLQAGLPVIATATNANKEIISEKNGILIQDNYIEFANAIAAMVKRFKIYSSDTIKETVSQNTWLIIVSELRKYLNNLVNKIR